MQIILTTKDGDITMEMATDVAPKHVERIATLSDEGFYDGLKFHRVIDGFMAQTGCPRGMGTGGSSKGYLKAEFSNVPFKRGTVGMARSQLVDSADSQFFICFDDAPFLNGQYTVVGHVVEGMDVVDKIKKGNKMANGTVDQPDSIVKMRVVHD